MNEENPKPGKVQTVLGVIEPSRLGIVLPHEHFFIDMSGFFIEPGEEFRKMSREAITLENLSWIRSHRMNNLFNLQPFPVDLAIEEVLLFKNCRSDEGTVAGPVNDIERNLTRFCEPAHPRNLGRVVGFGDDEPGACRRLLGESRDVSDERASRSQLGRLLAGQLPLPYHQAAPARQIQEERVVTQNQILLDEARVADRLTTDN